MNQEMKATVIEFSVACKMLCSDENPLHRCQEFSVLLALFAFPRWCAGVLGARLRWAALGSHGPRGEDGAKWDGASLGVRHAIPSSTSMNAVTIYFVIMFSVEQSQF